jgi:hypothetical protein
MSSNAWLMLQGKHPISIDQMIPQLARTEAFLKTARLSTGRRMQKPGSENSFSSARTNSFPAC